MTEHFDPTWFTAIYDEIVNEAGSDGLELEKSRDAVAHRYADAVESGEINRYSADLVTEGREIFNRTVTKTRQSRKTTMRKSMDQILAVIEGTDFFDNDDPILEWSFPLGDDDGRDKTLRYWTVDDWKTSWTVRFSRAAQASSAADEYYQRAKQIVAAMERSSARMTGDLPQFS